MAGVESDLPVNNSRTNRVGDNARLFHDFLHHKVLIAAFFGRGDVPIDLFDFYVNRVKVAVEQLCLAFAEHGNLVVLEVADAAGVADYCGDVRRDERLIAAEADDERAVLSRSDNAVRIVAAEDSERIRAFDRIQHFGDGIKKIALIVVFKQLRYDLGVCLGREGVAFFD